MFRRSIVWLILALTVPAFAQSPLKIKAIDHTDVPDGVYVFTKSNGVVTLVPLDLTKPVISPSPTPTPTPTPSPLTPFQAETQRLTKVAMAKGGTETTGAGISSVYSLAADGLSATPPTLDVSVAADFVRRGTTAVVNAQKEQVAWSEFSTAMDDTITTLRAKGDLKTAAQFSAAFRDVAKGMDSATGFTGKPKEVMKLDPATAGLFGNIDLAKLIELIKLIMELLKLFSPAMLILP